MLTVQKTMLLSEAIESLCIATRANGRSQRTVKAYREKLGHLIKFFGDVQIADVTVHDLRRFLSDQWDRGLSPFTVLTRVRAIKRLFNFAVEEEIVAKSPAKRIKTPNPEPEPKGLNLDDIARILSTCGNTPAGKRDRAIMFFLLDSGCRAGGVCDLKLETLDLVKRHAQVVEKGKRRRTVMFTIDTTEALKQWLDVRPEYQVDNVFVSLKVKRGYMGELTPSGVWQLVNRRSRDAGFNEPVSVHAFRHTFAIRYLMDGGDLASLADILGHKDVSTTKKWYGNFTRKELQEKHEKHSPVVQMMKDNGNG